MLFKSNGIVPIHPHYAAKAVILILGEEVIPKPLQRFTAADSNLFLQCLVAQEQCSRSQTKVSLLTQQKEIAQQETSAADAKADAAQATICSMQSDVQQLQAQLDTAAATYSEWQQRCLAAEATSQSAAAEAAQAQAAAQAATSRHAVAAADIGAVLGELTESRDAAVAEAQVTCCALSHLPVIEDLVSYTHVGCVELNMIAMRLHINYTNTSTTVAVSVDVLMKGHTSCNGRFLQAYVTTTHAIPFSDIG